MFAVSVGNPSLGKSSLGALIDVEKNQMLPFVFDNVGEAQSFLEAAERSGVGLYAGMPYVDIAPLVRLWRDAYKRDSATPDVDSILRQGPH